MSRLLTLVKELVEAAGLAASFATADHFHLKLEQDPYMPLVIESWDASPSYLGEQRHISVAHYFYQQGDAIADPDILMTDTGIPIYLQQVLGFTRIISSGQEPFKTVIDENARYNVERFMDLWADNIRDQGWLAVAKQKGEQTNTDLSDL